MSNKVFAERLNQTLDDIGLPEPFLERVDSLSKLLHIPRFKAESLLNGIIPLDKTLLEQLAIELEVSAQWLLGED